MYAGSTVTAGAAVCAIMEFCLNNSLTFKAMDEMLKLLQIIIVHPNKLPRSLYTLRNFFNNFTTMDYTYYKICVNCKEKSDKCHCNKLSTGDLLEIPIDKPLKVIVSRKLFYNN